MIELDKQGTPITDATGKIVGYNTQRVKKPNSFFLDPSIIFDWNANICSVDGDVYYLDNSVLQTAESTSIPSKDEWLNTYGSTIVYDYYDFTDSKNNPSGNQKNIYRARYKDSKDRVKYIFEYAWDANDNCVSCKSLAPEGAEAEVEKVIKLLRKFTNGILMATLKCVMNDTLYIAPLDDYTTEKGKFSFRGWRFSGGSMLPKNDNGAYYVVMNDNYDVEAVWVQLQTVTLYSNDVIYEIKTVDYGTSINDVIPDTDTQEFAGWSLTEGATIADYPKGTDILVASDLVLYAVWTDKSTTNEE